MQGRIKYFSRFGRLAGSTEALAEALSPGRSVHYLAAIKEELDGQAPAAAA
jgi:hypothetical protein